MNTIKHGCYWVLASGQQCGKPVGYRMVRDDDNNKVRDYAPYCDVHTMENIQNNLRKVDDDEL